jgi:hypothetical protein
LRALVVTGGLHKKETEIRPIVMIQNNLSRESAYFEQFSLFSYDGAGVHAPGGQSAGRL